SYAAAVDLLISLSAGRCPYFAVRSSRFEVRGSRLEVRGSRLEDETGGCVAVGTRGAAVDMFSGRMTCGVTVLLVAVVTGWPARCWAQPTPPPSQAESQELAKQLSNPISSLVSLPFQFNWEQNVGPHDQTRFVLNVQPVMPFALNPKVNLIARVIVP